MNTNTHETAIARKTLSAPAKRLVKLGLISGRVLDYGCGRGKDAEILNCEGYDPYYFPTKPRGKFDTILCSYVLNVLTEESRQEVIDSIKRLLKSGGSAYISVRRDTKNFNRLDRQFNVQLDLPTVYSNSSFCIYKLVSSVR